MLAGAASPARADILSFESLQEGFLTGSQYGGVTWGTSAESAQTNRVGEWLAVREGVTNAQALSDTNYVINAYGADEMSFRFAAPVNFVGAWFSRYAVLEVFNYSATEVRFRDDLGNVSSWLTLNQTPGSYQWEFLQANFVGSQSVWVERRGAPGAPPGSPQSDLRPAPGEWYAMDDVTYEPVPATTAVPEPSSLLLLGVGGLLAWRRRRAR